MTSLRNTALGLAMGIASASVAAADGHTELTIAIVNNGHMINMQKVAEAYTADTGVTLNWVSLEEGVLREQVTSDTATGGGQCDIINIGMQDQSGALQVQAGSSHLSSAQSTTLTTCYQQCAMVCHTKVRFMQHHSMVSLQWLCTART